MKKLLMIGSLLIPSCGYGHDFITSLKPFGLDKIFDKAHICSTHALVGLNNTKYLDTSDLSGIGPNFYTDIKGDTQKAFTVFIKPTSVPKPCEGINDYSIDIDASKTPFKVWGQSKQLSKGTLEKKYLFCKQWLLEQYPVSGINFVNDSIFLGIDTSTDNGLFRIKLKFQTFNYTIDLYFSNNGILVIKYSDQYLNFEDYIGRNKLFDASIGQNDVEGGTGWQSYHGIVNTITNFQRGILKPQNCINWVFQRDYRDDYLKVIQVLDSVVIYTYPSYDASSLPVMIKKQKNEMAIQGQGLPQGYYIFKGFTTYMNVLGATTQAIMFYKFTW